jgi:hypothetical protein
MSRKAPNARILCQKPNSKKEDLTQDLLRRQKRTSQRNAQISLTNNGDGTFDVNINAKNLRLRTKKQGKVITLLDIEDIALVELTVGNIAFKPKVIVKIERRITSEDRFKIAREQVRQRIKEPQLL